MADWTLLALTTPSDGSEQLSELSMASNRNMAFNLIDASTLSFELPGRHWQTPLIEPLVTDILVFRDDYAVQRFRVISMSVTKSGGDLKCSYTAVSYKDIINTWIFHSGHTRNYTDTEQTAIAWDIITDSETMDSGDIAVTRGTMPTSNVNRTLVGQDSGSFYATGARKGDAIKELAAYDDGFEWDIEPDRTSVVTERTGLKFNVWNAGLRKQYTPRCPFVLDDGGNVMAWTRQSTPSEYANVVFLTGKNPPDAASETDPPTAWEPSDEDPGGTPPEGRWERSISSEATSSAAVSAAATAALERALAYQPAWAVELTNGKWSGPSEMWLGDYCRLIVNDGPVDVDSDVRVIAISITVDGNGSEKISLTLDRPARSYTEFRSDLERRLLNLERR